jgi:hypothetical protein
MAWQARDTFQRELYQKQRDAGSCRGTLLKRSPRRLASNLLHPRLRGAYAASMEQAAMLRAGSDVDSAQ